MSRKTPHTTVSPKITHPAVRFEAVDNIYGNHFLVAWPLEHLVYVEMDPNDPDVQARESHMMKVHKKWFYWLLRSEVELRMFVGDGTTYTIVE
jgi:hypothetical protein